jgi:ketosteroid isomerase-like protein
MFEPGAINTQTDSHPLEVLKRMVAAQNRHDLDGMVACFSRDYQSEQPFYPERNFVGQGGVRKNWGFFFKNIPDIQVDLLSEAVDGDTIWAELFIHGTQLDGKKHSTRGVVIQRIRDGLIVWARLYIYTQPGNQERRMP